MSNSVLSLRNPDENHPAILASGPKDLTSPIRVFIGTSSPDSKDIQIRYFRVDPTKDIEVPNPEPAFPLRKITSFHVNAPPIPLAAHNFGPLIARLIAPKLAEFRKVLDLVRKLDT